VTIIPLYSILLGDCIETGGTVRITIEAGKPDGFDETWLRNPVYEPLDEAGVKVEESRCCSSLPHLIF
jgi:hypothetical protein